MTLMIVVFVAPVEPSFFLLFKRIDVFVFISLIGSVAFWVMPARYSVVGMAVLYSSAVPVLFSDHDRHYVILYITTCYMCHKSNLRCFSKL